MGLTTRLVDALRDAETRYPIRKGARSCVRLIPNNVDYSVQADGSFTYDAEIFSDKPYGLKLFDFSGSCSEQDLYGCAVAILEGARQQFPR